ncbi:magnesium transporter [Lysinibacillus sphaericus]|uniref:magnesium transporter n=1 Tax=Lysinibacillus sphaericus TaxID=1421 RepID=UPI0018CE4049|nr:magnesium transporter [Lysinibacillus sphaericus]MBG9453266.1 magnesium transporter [Lysinibacillus sphaericus]MBG9455844.1 magnesium transporter [Lysinibacillus sphaericus]MBG9455904.1 magnesium transporter [Lysinibacillus sphaericus]MBG9455920.1 magnesium transporter [Lysinibacillus sphaericus]MBG9476120.1 magnesium transporter [Lysinibacillus sphaericus]
MIKNMTENQITLQIFKSLKEGKQKEFQAILKELQPYDIARIFEGLPEKHHTRFLLFLTSVQIAELIQELEKVLQLKVLNKLGIEKSGQVMNLMDNDDLASLLENLSPDKIEELLSGMKQEESKIVQNIMNYPPETAGRIMTNRFVWIPQHFTIRESVDKLKIFAEFSETINYLYVIDNDKKLVGVVSYRDLIISNEFEKIQDIMYSRVISVSAETDQEEVARAIERYDFLSIPVVEKNNELVGIVTVDDIIDVVIKEANEDIEKLSASGKAIDFDTKAHVAAYRRLPWLILLLFIGLVSGTIISSFEETLSKVVALAFFMPMIAGMTGNTGTQSLAVVVRGLITTDTNKRVVFKLIIRELKVGLIIGITCGILISIIAYIWQGSPVLGLVVGSSLVITLIIGTLAGTIIPLILYKFKIDPAVASGPLITTLNDILSLLIYFGIATMFISKLM